MPIIEDDAHDEMEEKQPNWDDIKKAMSRVSFYDSMMNDLIIYAKAFPKGSEEQETLILYSRRAAKVCLDTCKKHDIWPLAAITMLFVN